jgi:hypothetical protein
MRYRAKGMGVLGALIAVCVVSAAVAHAELAAKGDLFVKFTGRIVPQVLPRTTRAPISVQLGGTVRTLGDERPPPLREIVIAVNRDGHLDTQGLPICRRAEIETAATAQAMKNCGDALVGRGHFAGDVAFPEQEAFPSRGHLLAFNTVVGGRPAIFAQVYGAKPAPASSIIVFRIKHTAGTYGTVLTGVLPEELNTWANVRSISLNLHREYFYRGRLRSYLSAACKAPSGFDGAVFPFAQGAMVFSDGRTLSTTLTRSCKVRG